MVGKLLVESYSKVAFLFVSLFRSCFCHVCVLVVVLVSSVFQTVS